MPKPDDTIRRKFIEAYMAMDSYPSRKPPLIVIPAEAAELIETIASLRMRNWSSSLRATNSADAIGLLGELAVLKWAQYSPAEAWNNFHDGLGGDSGIDLIYNGVAFDVKTSAVWTPRWIMTLSNRNKHQADALLYTWLGECQDGSINCHLMGWSWLYEAMTLVRRSQNHEGLGRISYKDLKRAGTIYPVAHLDLIAKSQEVI